MDDQSAQIVEKIRASNNFLVTVSSSPTVDQLTAAIGLTMILSKMNKRATAVFSGEVPPVIRFLRPDKTLQKNADNLQDFIISLDKSKADKLRYKVEDDVVRIFITPYKTSLSSKDLTFGKGDFNVEVVLALGVSRKEDLDNAITAHGRILHDATVISLTNTDHAQLGTIHLEDPKSSSISELVLGLARTLGMELVDDRIATALLTGIVAETEHFGNDKTTPMTLTASADLLEAGANQQLVSMELSGQKVRDGARQNQERLKSYKQLATEHGQDGGRPGTKEQPAVSADTPAPEHTVQIPESPETAEAEKPVEAPKPPGVSGRPAPETRALPPVSAGPAVHGTPTQKEPDVQPPKHDGLSNGAPVIEVPPAKEEIKPPSDITSGTPSPTPMLDSEKTLADIETEVKSQHAMANSTNVDSARQAVESALNTPAEEPAGTSPAAGVPGGTPATSPQDTSAPMAGLPDFLRTPSTTPPGMPSPAAPLQPSSPTPDAGYGMPSPAAASISPMEPLKPQPHNPAANEQAPLSMSPADQPFTMPLPPAGPAAPPAIESDELPPGLQTNSTAGPPSAPPPLPPIPPSMPPPGPGISHH